MINAVASLAHLQLFVFSSHPFPHQKKKGFHPPETDVACHSSPCVTFYQAFAKHTLSLWKTVYEGDGFELFICKYFPVYCPVYSSAKYIVL